MEAGLEEEEGEDGEEVEVGMVILERTERHSASVYSESGSRFRRRVPGNKIGSWARKVMRWRRVCLSTCERSISSILMVPVDGCRVASKDMARVDFPEPVRPMMAVELPPRIRMLMSSRLGGRWGA